MTLLAPQIHGIFRYINILAAPHSRWLQKHPALLGPQVQVELALQSLGVHLPHEAIRETVVTKSGSCLVTKSRWSMVFFMVFLLLENVGNSEICQV